MSRQFPLAKRQLSLVVVAAWAAIAPTALAAVAAREGFPATVRYEGPILGAGGEPLSGSHEITATYFDGRGDQLYRERLGVVEIVRGTLELELGNGVAWVSNAEEASDRKPIAKPEHAASYASLAAVFAAHPQVTVELAVDGRAQSPRVGILPAGHSLESRLVAAGSREPDDGRSHWQHYRARSGATAVQAAVLAPAEPERPAPAAASTTRRTRPFTLPVVGPTTSPRVTELPLALEQPGPKSDEINPPRHESLVDAAGNRFGTVAPRRDDALVTSSTVGSPSRLSPALDLQFEGINNVNGVLPPDTEGAVGPNHYLQVVNLAFAVYDKGGTPLTGPSNTNTLWAGFGGPCETDNSGDAIFLYDEEANRFVLTQFAVAGSHQSVCFAVSQTPDPTGAYHLYEAVTPRFPDYYKVGVWPDPENNAYFFGTNSGTQGQYDVFAVDRANMLSGSPARAMQFFQNFVNLMMPADLDGYDFTGPPPAGSPGIFYTFRDGGESYFSNPPNDSIDVWEFDVDWTTPANSTFTLVASIGPAEGLADFNWTVCGFFVSDCIPQPGTTQGIDSASWWPMQRLVYRNFGTHETLVGTWTVDVLAAGNRAAPRWFELRDSGSGWTIYQQGTHSPDAIHRFMPSIAMDNSGNIALGYSRGDGSNFPSIYYATREAGDALGTLQAEAQMIAGGGSQTSSSARWGDYSSMELDPADDCTFWFTTEYLAATSSSAWRTRVGSFKSPSCGAPRFTVDCAPANLVVEQYGAAESICTVAAFDGYSGTVDLSCLGAPAGVGCAFSPASIVLPVDGSDTSTLTLSVDAAQAVGSYSFEVEGDDGSDSQTAQMNVTVVPPGYRAAIYNPSLGAPECATVGSVCDSTTLLDSRDNIGPDEPNQPNTLDTCADGTSGTYHDDESNDRIVVKTLDGGSFSAGDTVEVEVTVWAWNLGADDTLDLYHAADATSPSWTHLGSIAPPGGGAQTLTTQFVLPAGSLQAIRANFRFQGAQSTCGTGSWDDTDDLVFAVGAECGVDADCDDGLFCNGEEICSPSFACEAGAPPTCDDGLFCNGEETCNEDTDVCDVGTPPSIDDSVACTEDSCDEANDVAVHVPNDALCDNGLFCDGAETCDAVLDCQGGAPPVCDDGEFCNGEETCDETIDSCVPGTAPPDTYSSMSLAGPLAIVSCGTLTIGPSVTISGAVSLQGEDAVILVEPITVLDSSVVEVRLDSPQ